MLKEAYCSKGQFIGIYPLILLLNMNAVLSVINMLHIYQSCH